MLMRAYDCMTKCVSAVSLRSKVERVGTCSAGHGHAQIRDAYQRERGVWW